MDILCPTPPPPSWHLPHAHAANVLCCAFLPPLATLVGIPGSCAAPAFPGPHMCHPPMLPVCPPWPRWQAYRVHVQHQLQDALAYEARRPANRCAVGLRHPPRWAALAGHGHAGGSHAAAAADAASHGQGSGGSHGRPEGVSGGVSRGAQPGPVGPVQCNRGGQGGREGDVSQYLVPAGAELGVASVIQVVKLACRVCGGRRKMEHTAHGMAQRTSPSNCLAALQSAQHIGMVSAWQ